MSSYLVSDFIKSLRELTIKRLFLLLCCFVLSLSIVPPSQVKAFWPFGDDKKQPSILPAQKVDITKDQQVASSAVTGDSTDAKSHINREHDREDTSKRTPFTSTYINKDRTRSLEYSTDQQNYLDNSKKWQKIDNKIDAVENAAPAPNLWEIITNTAPNADPPTEFNGKAGLVSTKMKKLADGLDIVANGKTITMKPVGAKNVIPERLDDRTVIYKDAWQGVDLQYQLRGELVKEIIVIKDKSAETSFNFTVSGGKVINHPTRIGELSIEGMPEEFSFSSLTLDVNKKGIMTDPPLSQMPTSTGLSVKLDSKWVDSQSEDSFPLKIDPSFGRSATSYWVYKSDGYSCNISNCYANTGSINDGSWKSWRTFFQFPFSDIAGKIVVDASIHGYYQTGAGGTTDSRYMTIGHATCLAYSCPGTPIATTLASTDFDIDLTSSLQQAVNNSDWGAVWSIVGQEGTTTTYKPYSSFYASVVYDTATPQTAPYMPADGQVTVSTTPSLKINAVTDPDGDPVQYYYRVSTSPNAENGAVINSGWTPSLQWTVPDGILQDGTTYYWHVYTMGATVTTPNWVRSFKIDLRTGKDSTQAYETVGAIGVDLATGNATTSNSTHSMNALGGNIGLNFDYNSPTRAQNGLTGEYWNVATNYSGGVPSATPNLVRNDQNINFSWPSGSSPTSPDTTLNNDWFYARWKGYFVAPTTGSYQFGANVDDSIDANINSQTAYAGSCSSGVCYGSAMSLTAGQVVPVDIKYIEGTGNAYVNLYVKGAVSEQVVPSEWFRTEVRATVSQYGLTGRYYADDGTHTYPSDPNKLMMVRNDSKLTFNWGSGGPAPGLQSDDFITKWTGYITVPTTGSYTLGATSNDGVRIKLNNGFLGSQQTVLDSWTDQDASLWGTATTLTAGQQVPITIEYYEHTNNAQFNLYVRASGIPDQEMPVKWLTPQANALPDAWRLGVDVDGNVGYERLRATANSVILEDSTRATHEYTWTGSGYKPPVNEDGNLTRNSNNTYTFIDTDGRTYIFDAEGKLTSLTSPSDDKNPANLKYDYSGDPSRLMTITDGVTSARYGSLYYKSINDDSTLCPVPSGFDAAPDGMLCAFKTSDNDITRFYYKAGQLSRVEKPGSEKTDYGYDSLGRMTSTRDSVANDAIAASVRTDDNNVMTEMTYDAVGRVDGIKAPAPTQGATRVNSTFEFLPTATQPVYRYYKAPDNNTSTLSNIVGYSQVETQGYILSTAQSGTHAVYACFNGWDQFVSTYSNCEGLTVVGLLGYVYDSAPSDIATVPFMRCVILSNGDHFTWPAAGCDGSYVEQTLGYMLPASTNVGTTLMHVGGATEPNGFSKKVEFDSLFRTTRETDLANLSTRTQWDDTKDLQLSKTDPTGLKSTTVYDDEDRVVANYGPAPSPWFDATTRIPTSTYTNQVPKTTTAYDESLSGPSATFYDYKANSKSLVGAPKLNSYGLPGTSTPANLSSTYSSAPITVSSGADGWGVRATGKIRVPTTGTYTFTLWHDDGIRMYVDDNLIIDDWNTGGVRQSTAGLTLTAGKVYRISIQYFHTTASSVSSLNDWYMSAVNAAPASPDLDWSAELKPDYSLKTSETVYDSTIGNMTTTKSYTSPEYGLATASTIDPSGLNLQTTSTYETPGASGSFLRQTGKTLPGGNATTYQHYAASDTRDDPCTTGTTEAYHQAGRPKGKTEADPDGSGSQTSRTSETIYNESGDVVATRFNSDSWTCMTYDSRGRVTSLIIPTISSRVGRTITNNYAVSSNPLVNSISDDKGTITTTVDLLGRTVSYTDTNSKTTTSTYDDYGKLTGRSGPLGTEAFTYDSTDRLTGQSIDSTTIATPHYDSYGRLSSVDYPTAGTQKLSSITYDNNGRDAAYSYTLGDSSTASDTVTRSQAGQILTDSRVVGSNTLSSSYSYDKANRLTGATIGSHTYDYNFGALDSSCGSGAGINPNASKDSNRVKMTVDSAVTTYCYDYADRLVGSSDASLTSAAYDDHGNTTSLGSGTPTAFTYDAGDRNVSITEGSKSVTYERDAQDRLTKRVLVNGSTTTNYYSYSGSGDSPDTLLDNSGTVLEKYLSLPGGTLLTIRPASNGVNQHMWSLQNIHGDTFLTTDKAGTKLDSFDYDPFGNKLSTNLPMNTATGSTYGWLGENEKDMETVFAVTPMQMGARVYFPSMGRFGSVDSVEGGTLNNYVYAMDPINQYDLNGKFIPLILGALYLGGLALSAYDAHKSPTPLNIGILVVSAIPGGVVAGSAAKGLKIAMSAKRAVGNNDLGTAGKMTANFAKKFYTAGVKDGTRAIRGPVVKRSGQRAGQNVMNFDRFKLQPTSKKMQGYPNRIADGHLKIKGWW